MNSPYQVVSPATSSLSYIPDATGTSPETAGPRTHGADHEHAIIDIEPSLLSHGNEADMVPIVLTKE